jgi:hypothetical protein
MIGFGRFGLGPASWSSAVPAVSGARSAVGPSPVHSLLRLLRDDQSRGQSWGSSGRPSGAGPSLSSWFFQVALDLSLLNPAAPRLRRAARWSLMPRRSRAACGQLVPISHRFLRPPLSSMADPLWITWVLGPDERLPDPSSQASRRHDLMDKTVPDPL